MSRLLLKLFIFIPKTLMERDEELENLEVWEENQGIDETSDETENSHNEKETRYKEQLKGSREEAMRLRNLIIDREVKAAEKDARSLLELHETDPKLANEVAKRFGYDDYEDARWEIEKKVNGWVEKTDDANLEEKFEKMYQERKAKEIHDEAIKQANKILKKIKDDGLREMAEKKFERLTKGKTLSIDEAEELAEMATLYVNKDNLRESKYEEWLWDYASTGMWMWKKAWKAKEDDWIVVNGRMVLNSNKQD